MKLDPVKTEVYWARLLSAVDEAAMTLIRTAFSGIVRDNHDFACGLLDATGRLLAQDTMGTPGLAGPMPITMGHFLAAYPASALRPGDVLITNDPWKVAGHLSDTTLLTPLFSEDTLVGFAMCVAHQMDIGGRGMTTETRDVYEEGLWIPILKLYDAGVANESLFAIIRHNVRIPEMVVGDLRAQLASNEIAGRHLLRLVQEIGPDGVLALADEITDRTEASTRAAIERVPDGTYRSVALIDRRPDASGALGDPLRVEVAVTVTGSNVLVDFAGTSPQVEVGINACLYGLTMAYALMGLKSALDPLLPINGGFLRPITITAPEGCLMNPLHPAPVQGRTQVAHFAVEGVLRALASAIPERVIAGCGSLPSWNQQVTGRLWNGRSYIHFFPIRGGLGARPDSDGVSCLSFPSNVATLPVELLEAESSVIFERKEFLPDSAGAGRFRGGVGQELVLRVQGTAARPAQPVAIGMSGGRMDFEVPGLHGGGAAPKGVVEINGKPVRTGHQWALQPGDVVRYRVPGGGGCYDPLTRDPERVRADVRAGLVSLEAAARLYGVVLSAGGEVDRAATAARREGRRGS